MNEIDPQRKKAVLLAAALAMLPMPGSLLAQHIPNGNLRHTFLLGWSLMLLLLLVFVIREFIKLKRRVR